MFESNMTENMRQISALKAIQGDKSNPWRNLVSREFKEMLDSMSTYAKKHYDNDLSGDEG